MLTNIYSCPRTGSYDKPRHAWTFITVLLSCAISFISHAQYISTIAGTGTAGYSGDGGAAMSAKLDLPFAIALDASGNLYIVDDENQRIRKITVSTNTISTIAGTGTTGTATSSSSIGDGGLATAARLNLPEGIVVDASGNIYISDYNDKRIRKITAGTGIISTVAGTGTQGYSGDGAAASAAKINAAQGIALDASGNLYIADAGNNRIRKVTASTGIITTIAGTGTAGYSGDGSAATAAKLNYPSGVALDASGNIYIADNSNNRIRKIAASTGIITTIAGTGSAAYSGDGGPATSAAIKYPQEVNLDRSGNIYISDVGNSRIRVVSAATGIITTIAGSGTAGYGGDGGLATAAELYAPDGVAFDAAGDMYIADSENNRIRKVISKDPLPITLVSFSATAGEGQTVDLRWLTASEINSRYYEIQRSADAVEFSVIGTEQAAGNSTVPLDYSYTDDAPIAGTSYYRLREVDCDGRDTYSATVDYTDIANATVHFSIYPNPCAGTLHIETNAADGMVKINNPLGETVYNAILNTGDDYSFQPNLPKGIYYAVLQTGGQTLIRKLIIE